MSAALASRVLTRLSKLELLDTHGAGPQRFWKVSNAGGLLDWGPQKNNLEHRPLVFTSGADHRKNY